LHIAMIYGNLNKDQRQNDSEDILMSEEGNNQNNEQKQSRASMNDMAKKVTKGNKTAGIIVAIFMIILGVLFFARPIITEVAGMYLATAGFVIYGIYQIIMYAKTASDQKNGWTLANGIIFVILGLLIIFSRPINMLYTFAFLLGFLAIFGGINQLTAYGQVKGQPGAGWLIASGIINLILGAFFMFTPFAATFILAYVLGIYLMSTE
jgi:uncharacterized membrane protein HdeD (DUF308 family)